MDYPHYRPRAYYTGWNNNIGYRNIADWVIHLCGLIREVELFNPLPILMRANQPTQDRALYLSTLLVR